MVNSAVCCGLSMTVCVNVVYSCLSCMLCIHVLAVVQFRRDGAAICDDASIHVFRLCMPVLHAGSHHMPVHSVLHYDQDLGHLSQSKSDVRVPYSCTCLRALPTVLTDRFIVESWHMQLYVGCLLFAYIYLILFHKHCRVASALYCRSV